MGLVVGIGGVSRAGKSTLSKMLKNTLHDSRMVILDMDDFVYPENQIPRIKNKTDWESPESVDYRKISGRIIEAKAAHDVVILEGILIFWVDSLNNLFDKKLFVEIPYEIFLERKRKDRRWNEPKWYIQHIWDSYLKYGIKNSEDSMKVDGNRSFEISEIQNFLKTI